MDVHLQMEYGGGPSSRGVGCFVLLERGHNEPPVSLEFVKMLKLTDQKIEQTRTKRTKFLNS